MQDAGVQLEGAETSTPAAAAPPDDPGFVEFVVAGTRAAGEFRCADCGYGAIVQRALPPCPMCSGTVWESRGARLAH